MRAKGIDVSHWNGTWDPQDVENAGYSFCYLKATEGTTFEDNQFKVHWEAAKQTGLLRGAYHFWRYAYDPYIQMQHFRDFVGEDIGEMPPMLDLEDTNAPKKVAGMTVHLKACVAEIQRLFGKKPIIYTGRWWWDAWLGTTLLKDFDLWVASYRSTILNPVMPHGWDNWTLWQHSSKGRVPGVQGNCDVNVFNGMSDELNTWAGQVPPVAPIYVVNVPKDIEKYTIEVNRV